MFSDKLTAIEMFSDVSQDCNKGFTSLVVLISPISLVILFCSTSLISFCLISLVLLFCLTSLLFVEELFISLFKNGIGIFLGESSNNSAGDFSSLNSGAGRDLAESL